MRMPVSFVKRSIRSSITLPSAPVRPFQKLIVGFAWPAAGRPRAVVRAAAPSAAVPPMKRRRVSPPERDGVVMVCPSAWCAIRASLYGCPRGGVNVAMGGRQARALRGLRAATRFARSRTVPTLDESAQSAPEAADVGAGCCLDRRRALRRYPILLPRLVMHRVAGARALADHQH